MRILLNVFLYLLCCVCSVKGQNTLFPELMEPITGDSIIHHVVESSDWYARVVGDYRANLYVRGHFKVHKRNILLRVVPSMFRFEKGVNDYIVESQNEVHYSAPDIYDVKMQALTGTFHRNDGEIGNVMDYFNMNIYSTDLLPDKLISPFTKNGHRYYYYILDSIFTERTPTEYKVLIVPRYKSNQLVNGYVTVRDKSWTVADCCMAGKVEQVGFEVRIKMGADGKEMYLPKRLSIKMLFKFVGNKIGADYTAVYDYKDIKLAGSVPETLPQKRSYNLSDYYRLTVTNDTINTDLAHMDSLRAYPLSSFEEELYGSFAERETFKKQNVVPKSRQRVFWGEVGDMLISNYTFRFNKLSSLKCYPLLNPLQLRYSHSNGFSYIQRFKFNQYFERDRSLYISPRIGYNFKYKEFYWRCDANYTYYPEKLGRITLNVGNGNRIYSSEVLDRLEQYPDSILDFDKLKLDYFKDLYVRLGNDFEITNGLLLTVGLSYHKRTLVDKTNIYDPELQNYLSGELRDTYSSFAPRIRLEWTPRQYYYMDGHRKINLYSNYPTVSVDWERGIKGVFGSTGKYERIELDMQQKFKFGGIRYISYRVGCGAFTEQEDMYFVDFFNLRRNNLPDDWNDDIGGTFQLLDSRWYNWSNKYIRGHVTYETPFLLFRQLRKYVNLIESERLYGGILFMPRLIPYVELGYGIGTHIFDCGAFVSFIRGQFDSFGCKFTFELFR